MNQLLFVFMSKEKVEFESPTVFDECKNCEFVERAIEKLEGKFYPTKKVKLKCELAGGGGSTQVEPGVFVRHKNRYIIATPETLHPDYKKNFARGMVYICPVDINDAPERYPLSPHNETGLYGYMEQELEWVGSVKSIISIEKA